MDYNNNMKTNNNYNIKFNKPKGLYIHIPFCDHICIYCDFFKMMSKERNKEVFLEYLIKELNFKRNYYDDLETIYIGGGTPTNLNLKLLEKLLYEINKLIDINKIKEFTIECNPKDINQDIINLFLKYNINRISLGVQSMYNEKLLFLGRNHLDIDVINSINLLQNNNINNISCDLIYGLNSDSIDLIKNDIDRLISLNIKHLSCYTLIIEDKTILKKFINNGYKPLDDDSEAEIFDFINEYLESKGFIHYEISNYACEGYQSKHNLIYWDNENYIGIGPAASYYLDNIRYTNIKSLNKYYKYVDELIKNNLSVLDESLFEEKLLLSNDDIFFEEIMMGLRKLEGININKVNEKFNINIFDELPNLNILLDKGLLEVYTNNTNKYEYIKVKKDQIYKLNSILTVILEDYL